MAAAADAGLGVLGARGGFISLEPRVHQVPFVCSRFEDKQVRSIRWQP